MLHEDLDFLLGGAANRPDVTPPVAAAVVLPALPIIYRILNPGFIAQR